MESRIIATVDDELGLSEFVVHGLPSADDFIRALRDHYREHPTPISIWDLTSASLGHLDPAGFSAMAAAANAFSEDRGGNPRTAVVISDDVESILGRLYRDVSSVNESTVTYQIFPTRDEAMAWLMASD
ncbi:MAG: hypothetical protein RIC16_17120 [Rhodospirillales bacterium]